MKPVFRLTLLIAIPVMGLSAVALILGLNGTRTVEAMPAITQTPWLTPTATPVFTATLSIVPDRSAVRIGETLTMTADIDVSEGCIYPIFELSLAQDDSEMPIFTHIDPPVDMITGPISLPSQWTFQATGPGVATFDARTFGETYCGDWWIWQYLYGESGTVIVGVEVYESWLPTIR